MKYLLILGLVFFVLWRPLMRLLGRPAGPRSSASSASPQATAPEGSIDQIVPCAHCGLHLPRSDTVGREGRPERFCSGDHLDRGPRPGAR
ncbi:MAG: hypothetical protein EOP40_13105 [Rubrivivax sp.]|nr:MAG: hypothetical protein EOP40_13105 [Rubrivivax sp.]